MDIQTPEIWRWIFLVTETDVLVMLVFAQCQIEIRIVPFHSR